MKFLTCFFLIVLTFTSYAQNKTILVFDLVTGSVDSITNIQYDSTTLRNKTTYYLGTSNSGIEILEQVPPVNNIFPNSQFTRKKRASLDYDLTKYPIRTSVKIFSKKNDTLNNNCSGSMISRRHVLTAAHCVSIPESDTLYQDSLYVCPVFDNGNFNSTFPCSWVHKIYLFKDKNHSGYDFAILELNEPIGDLTGWISIGFDAVDSSLADGIYYKFSYPAISIPTIDSNEYNGDTLYYNYGKIDYIDKNFIGVYNANGIPGESGSSLIKVANNQSYTSYGVFSYSTGLMHSRINNWRYYYLESIIHNDLSFGVRNEKQEIYFTLFPNPSNDNFRIKNTGNKLITEIVILDVLGREVFHSKKIDVNSAITIKTFPEGIYLVQIITNKSQVTRKLIVHN